MTLLVRCELGERAVRELVVARDPLVADARERLVRRLTESGVTIGVEEHSQPDLGVDRPPEDLRGLDLVGAEPIECFRHPSRVPVRPRAEHRRPKQPLDRRAARARPVGAENLIEAAR